MGFGLLALSSLTEYESLKGSAQTYSAQKGMAVTFGARGRVTSPGWIT
ncbi:hypothetical protein TRIP_B10134 [uncultured Desulfatiglans sp.]|uniref:Uncharacterized protein n=1 Tax=Uncultured Desulfatiglans sp. TaxID=1748965 RepID=A0A653A040_UNCDX|nr:hypothetical protein TRIP_B10134 [uncultured Desulfatiglans sp.]